MVGTISFVLDNMPGDGSAGDVSLDGFSPRPYSQSMRKENIQTHEYRYTVLFEHAEEGGYVAYVPALPGCQTQGETLEEAREMAKEAILCYLESLRKDTLPIPPDITSDERVKEVLTVSLHPA